MKKTLIVLMIVLLSLVLVVSCDDNNDALPTITKYTKTVELGTKDGKAITWLVLDVDEEGRTALLISKNVLETRAFDSSSRETSQKNVYDGSTIQKYLNTTEGENNFFDTYGLSTSYMQKVNIESDNTGAANNIEITRKFDNGTDYVFLLSLTEAKETKYFENDEARKVEGLNGGGMSTYWWLRTANNAGLVDCVTPDGSTDGSNVAGGSTGVGLRPAFWYKY